MAWSLRPATRGAVRVSCGSRPSISGTRSAPG
nr:MAG TPA: hypothetical protein [Caudoviricetes sp.]